jgi:hypothetical protein
MLLLALVGAASAAEKVEDKSIRLSVDAPEGFLKAPELPKKDDFIGEAKGLFLSPDFATNGGAMLVHHMTLPGGLDFNGFKTALEPRLAMAFGNGYKLVKQEDVEAGKFAGFVLEFSCPGDGTKPDPTGSIPHHVRWYFFKDGDAKVIGMLYGARDASWKDLEPKYAASFKTLKQTD